MVAPKFTKASMVRGTYSFKTIEENEFDLDGYSFTVKISRVDNNIARITLINENKEQVDIPNNIRLHNLGDNDVSIPIRQSFFITWFGSYSLLDRSSELFRMTNQKQHLISGPKINGSRTYSFKTIEENEFDLDGYSFTVKISRVDNNIARITLINENKEQVDIPNNIRLRNLGDNFVSIPIRQSFFITWFASYSLLDGSSELVRMTNQKQHLISGPKINGSRTYVEGVLKPAKKRRIVDVGHSEADEDS